MSASKKFGGVKKAPQRKKQRKVPKRVEARKLFLKFRVRPLVRMPKSVMFAKLRRFVEVGIAPKDLEVAYMSYDHTVGKKFAPGERIQGHDHDELRKFYGVMLALQPQDIEVNARRGKYVKNPGSVRFERPE